MMDGLLGGCICRWTGRWIGWRDMAMDGQRLMDIWVEWVDGWMDRE